MQCPYENLGAVQNFLKEQPDCTHTEEFADVVTLKVTIPESDKDQFVKDMEPYRVCFKG
jgi:putative IMPACT (imprinted ancient) family translation regulator